MFAHSDKPISPRNVTFRFFNREYDGSKGSPIPYTEEDGDGTLFAFRETFGIARIVCARSLSDAHEVFIDESRTIEPADVHEAYGAFDKLREWLTSKGHEDNEHLRDFCNRYAPQFFLACGHSWELIEGYEYQSNSTGTGIVDVDHNLQVYELTPAIMKREEIICEIVQE